MIVTPPLGMEDTHTRAQLARLKALLNPALRDGGDLLVSFHRSFDEFLRSSRSSPHLNEETHYMIGSFVHVVTTISAALLESIEASEAVHQSLDQEILRLADDDFKQLSIQDIPPATLRNSPYAFLCFRWLLDHLHNPYPSKKIRADIARDSRSSEIDIDNWFIHARKEIGWNALRRSHFETRADMVKAATPFFKTTYRHRSNGRLNSGMQNQTMNDFSLQFGIMQDRARSLQPDSFTTDLLVDERSSRIKLSLDQRGGFAERQSDTLAYSSALRSPSHNAEFDIAQSASSSNPRPLKRKASSVGPLDHDNQIPRSQRPLKRNRIADGYHSSASLPSPTTPHRTLAREISVSMSPSVASSPLQRSDTVLPGIHKRKRTSSNASYDSDSSATIRIRTKRRVENHKHGDDLVSPDNDEPTASSSAPDASTALKRKRRLSDSHGDRPPKQLHHRALMKPRLQTVSNPLPLSGFEHFSTNITPGFIDNSVHPTSEDDFVRGVDLELESYTFENGSSLSHSQDRHNASYQDALNNQMSTSVDVLNQGQSMVSANFYLPNPGSYQVGLQTFDLSQIGASQTTTPSYPQTLYANSGDFGFNQQIQQAPAIDLMAEFHDVWQIMSAPTPDVSTSFSVDLGMADFMNSQSPASTTQPQNMLLSNMNHHQSTNVPYPTGNGVPFNGLQTYIFDDDKLAKQQKMQKLLAEVELLRSELDL